MASVVKRVGKTGTSWQVKWRYSGRRTGAGQSVTLDSERDAKRLKAAVEVRGHMVYDTDPEVLDRSIIGIRPTTPGEQPAVGGPTFEAVMDEWLDQHEGRGSTVRTHRARKCQLSAWLAVPIESLTDSDAEALKNDLSKRGLAPRPALSTAKAVCTYAVKRRLIPGNPFATVKIHRPDLKAWHRLSEEDFALLIKHAKTGDMRLMIETAYESGLREGELCALKPERVIIRKGRAWLAVRLTATRTDDGGWATGEPKTDNGIRDVEIPLDLGQRLKAHGNKHWTFPSRTGRMLSPGTVQTRWRRLREKIAPLGFSVPEARFHDIRHTFASDALDAGADDLGVSRDVGHSSIQITHDIYGHPSERKGNERMQKLQAWRAQTAPADRHLKAVS
ncbi:tyrosine-type recombinase/integrase [Kribbella albertanoniae]|uniref:Site-specific integrase n=1 Tax=Kribbella albertanoniae TaxID=1266829 RepID=A0A4R4PKH3_9ACTN|nr:site-specific integrase [Kribbella albertanoniae]TDC22448.1 site-specific integrase [Kribbella albertanoniae]